MPGVLGADVRYLLLQAGVSQRLDLGLLGSSTYRVVVGGFVWVVYSAGNRLGELFGPQLQQLEGQSSP